MLNNFEYLFWMMTVFFITPLVYTTLMTTSVTLGFNIYISTLKLAFHKYRHEQHVAVKQQTAAHDESSPIDFIIGRSIYFSSKNNKQKYFVYKKRNTKQSYIEMYL